MAYKFNQTNLKAALRNARVTRIFAVRNVFVTEAREDAAANATTGYARKAPRVPRSSSANQPVS